ncbi:MAG TPA: hypothetical protein VIJ35_14940 [Bradyrhizobium sp.]
MRWKIRSAPERSTRTAMPGYFGLESLGRPFRETLPSLRADSINAGITLVGGGGAALTGSANTTPAASALQ